MRGFGSIFVEKASFLPSGNARNFDMLTIQFAIFNPKNKFVHMCFLAMTINQISLIKNIAHLHRIILQSVLGHCL